MRSYYDGSPSAREQIFNDFKPTLDPTGPYSPIGAPDGKSGTTPLGSKFGSSSRVTSSEALAAATCVHDAYVDVTLTHTQRIAKLQQAKVTVDAALAQFEEEHRASKEAARKARQRQDRINGALFTRYQIGVDLRKFFWDRIDARTNTYNNQPRSVRTFSQAQGIQDANFRDRKTLRDLLEYFDKVIIERIGE